MSKAGERILEGAREAVAVAKGEQPAASITVKGHRYVPASEVPDRVEWNDNGTLDEIVSARGAHLEHMGRNHWFLIFYHDDGTETALWFDSKNLKKPFWETRSEPLGEERRFRAEEIE